MKLEDIKRITEAATGKTPISSEGLLFYAMARTVLPKLLAVAEAAKHLPAEGPAHHLLVLGVRAALADLESSDSHETKVKLETDE